MKRIMIALAAVAVAVGAQAASFNWTSTAKAMGISAATLASGLSAGTTYAVSGTANADSMKNLIESYSAAWAYEITLTQGDKTQTLTGTLGSSDFNNTRKIAVSGLATTLFDGATSDSPKSVDYSIIISGTIKDGNDATWTVTANEITGSATWAGTGDIAFMTTQPSSWTVAPEPTSGLMVLLGVAGLALKRKRA